MCNDSEKVASARLVADDQPTIAARAPSEQRTSLSHRAEFGVTIPLSRKNVMGSASQADRPNESRKDFFISYTKADGAWAEWIAWTLEAAGYSTVIQAWDFLPGKNFAIEMEAALDRARRMIERHLHRLIRSPGSSIYGPPVR
jgi:hypothetical protein